MSLREQMLKEVVISHEDLLQASYPQVKGLFKLAEDGQVVILNPENYSGENLILLFLIAKMYSNFLNFSQHPGADNSEIEKKLQMNSNTVRGRIKTLRDKQFVTTEGEVKLHKINLNLLDQAVNQIFHNNVTKLEVV